MPDSFGLSIFGAVTGAIGAISGLVGSFLGYKGYRRAQDVKALDLRLEFRKAVTDARAIVDDLPDLVSDAERSRDYRLIATGHQGGEATTAWIKTKEADREVLSSLQIELERLVKSDATTNNHAKLESRLVSIHALTTTATQLTTKCKKRIEDDEKSLARKAQVRAAILRGPR